MLKVPNAMRLRFTKMHGAGNDFVVLDGTRQPIALSAQQVRALGDRRFGVGADQILLVKSSADPGADFGYRIFNNSGEEEEQCGNGARCFARYVRDKGLTDRDVIRARTPTTLLTLRLQPDGRVTVDMNAPVFELPRIPFEAAGLAGQVQGGFELWPLELSNGAVVPVAVLSMGNPHAVQFVVDVEGAPVAAHGPLVEHHPRFERRVNAGFAQVVDRGRIRLRVHERGAGETLACGTGACAAVVAGIRLGLLDAKVDVVTRGGRLTIEWAGGASHVLMTGPAQTVFEGEVEL
jgi:diaminopimelate epimerase